MRTAVRYVPVSLRRRDVIPRQQHTTTTPENVTLVQRQPFTQEPTTGREKETERQRVRETEIER